MIYELLKNQLNNFGKLNNDGLGINIKVKPAVINEWYNIDAGNNIEIVGVQRKVNNTYDNLMFANFTEYINFGQGGSPESHIRDISGYMLFLNQSQLNSYEEFKVIYNINGVEKETEFTVYTKDALDLTQYETTYGENLGLFQIQIDSTDGSIISQEPPISDSTQGLVPTPYEIFKSLSYIGTHTTINITTEINDNVISANFNLVSLYISPS